ncbi:MAG: acylphosphatase [Actinobacteria bacterium]|nr:MAG: acylphosphatase [Actinomycetota bacterium]
MAELARTRVVVTGIVQGVFFRAATAETARGLGLAGWVRNLPDGGVEAVFEGPRGAVASAVAWCRTGPPRAVVERVEALDEEPERLTGFGVRY